ncbi:MAG TPA: phosphotransferase family protein [Acetobacteraceae bacterium]|nr:phosphotransferase family protein [Acetobacteraceae bacterium]
MLLPADKILDALIAEFDRLAPLLADADNEASTAFAIGHALRLLRAREEGGAQAVRAQFTRLDGALARVGTALQGPAALAAWDDVRARAAAEGNLTELEALWREGLVAAEHVMVAANRTAVPTGIRAELTGILAIWEADDLSNQSAAATPSGHAASLQNAPTLELLTLYLRDRFADESLTVTRVQPLAGGFGKQTTIFDVEGRALSGSFVMRRDLANEPTIANDCHSIPPEYAVIRAVRARGFKAPDALWMDTEHTLLPGGNFFVMRKAPGQIGGNFFGARMKVPESLADTLAREMAALHALPPLTELGAVTDSIRPELWSLDRAACTERYIRDWYAYFLSESHLPSPAIASLYGWMLDHIPRRSGRPSLLHGDIGFHNFLFEHGEMTALLDWEFCHIGDPAEELGYVKVTAGAVLDWNLFMRRYVAAGGDPVDDRTLNFFQAWAYLRNACAANILASRFMSGDVTDPKATILPHHHINHFIAGAEAVIAAAA